LFSRRLPLLAVMLVAAACSLPAGLPPDDGPDGDVARLVLSVASLTIRATEGAHPVATPVDRYERVVPGANVTWTSGNTAVAVVAPDGVVHARRPGQTHLTARSGKASAVVPVTVAPFTEYELVFERATGSGPVPFVVDLNGGLPRPLLPGIVNGSEPVASPDGRRIALVMNVTYGAPDLAEGDLFVANRDGSGLVRLTSMPGLEHQPAWSPDGSRIAFRSVRDGRGDVWVLDLASGQATNITPDPVPLTGDERYPAWSPDGLRIVYTSTITGNAELWTMADDGSGKERLTTTPAYEARPAWSPNGGWIAFTQRHPGGTTDLVVVTDEGRDYVRLELSGEQESPAWTPDSRAIAFSSNHLATPGVFLFYVTSFDVVRHTTGPDVNPGFLTRP
jgi:Tol biopolymer transport system component